MVSCDFNHGNCPKVYHQECLGFEVPEDSKRWVCPRHHCRDCLAWARHVCRYCPTSFCARVRSWSARGRVCVGWGVGVVKWVVCAHCDLVPLACSTIGGKSTAGA